MLGALLSIHAPGMAILPHMGVTASMSVRYPGLKIRVQDEVVQWQHDAAMVFDDTRAHGAGNHNGAGRMIRPVLIDRPIRCPTDSRTGRFPRHPAQPVCE